MPSTQVLKLTYFDLDGRAAVIRKTLDLGGVPFTDERVARDLSPLKPTLPYGKVPVLEVDGETIAETQAILRYVGRLTGIYPPPSEPLAAAMIDEMIDSLDDLFERLMAPSFVEQDAAKKKTMREALLAGPLPHAFELVDNRLAQIQKYAFFQNNASKVFLHEVLAWDYVTFMRSGMIDHIPTTFIDDYKTLVAMYDKVNGLASVNQRPTTVASSATMPAPPQQLKLTYFDMPGRAEQIRVALHIGGVAFEDERLPFEDVTKRRAEFPNDQVPVLQVNGATVLAQSVAILRYVGSFTGLYPVNDAIQAAKIDEVLSHIGELYFALDPSFTERDPVRKKEMRDKLATTTIPESLDGLNKRLALFKNQAKTPTSSFAMGGDGLTIADLSIYSLVMFLQSGFLDHVPTTMVDAYTHVVQSSDAVKNHSCVKAWYASRSLPNV